MTQVCVQRADANLGHSQVVPTSQHIFGSCRHLREHLVDPKGTSPIYVGLYILLFLYILKVQS